MEIGATWLLAAFGTGIAATSLLGGWFSNRFSVTHTRMQVCDGFRVGVDSRRGRLSPAAAQFDRDSGPHAAETAVGWMMTGMVLTLLLLYLFDFHEHDFSEEHSSQHDPNDRMPHQVKPVTWIGIANRTRCAFVDRGPDPEFDDPANVRWQCQRSQSGVFLAIALHKPLDALSIVSTMRANGVRRAARRAANWGFALLFPIAVFGTYWGAAQIGSSEMTVIGCALAFATGAFLCIALSDLLPEIHFHGHDRLKLALSFLIGIGIAYGLHWVEPGALHGISDPH